MKTRTAERILTWLVAANGAAAALAIFAVAMPTTLMDAGARGVGLGGFPDTPLTQYLARSASALYALFGALLLYIARHVRRYLDLLVVIGWLTILLGVILAGVDVAAGMPAAWTWGEGPPTVIVGAALVWLAHRARRGSPE